MNRHSAGIKVSLALLIGFVPLPQSHAQTATRQWVWQNPLPQGNTLHDVFTLDGKKIFAVGDAGTILRSSDAGVSWERLESGTLDRLNSVWFTDAMTGCVVGGTAFRSMALRTVDGGDTWTRQLSESNAGLTYVTFWDANVGYTLTGSGVIQRTYDGGRYWFLPGTGAANKLLGIAPVDQKVVVAVGGGTILRSTSEGWWFGPVESAAIDLRDVVFFDTEVGVAVGAAGEILRSTDQGETWVSMPRVTVHDLVDVTRVSTNTAIAVGSSGTLVQTSDAGLTWFEIDSSTDERLHAAVVVQGTGIAVGPTGLIIRSEDQGATWRSHSRIATREHLYGVWTHDENKVTAVGDGGVILHTMDGGASWIHQSSGVTQRLYEVSFLDPEVGIAVGDEGTIVGTRDGGQSWTVHASGTTTTLRGVHFSDVMIGTAVGEEGTALRTRDGGATWNRQASADRCGDPTEWGHHYGCNHFYDVFFADAMNGVAVGTPHYFGGRSLFTEDGGTTWLDPAGRVVFPGHFSSVWLVDAMNGVAVGGFSAFETQNGGRSWVGERLDLTSRLLDVSFADAWNGFAVGEHGIVLRSQTIPTALTIAGFEVLNGHEGNELQWSLFTDESIEGFQIYRAEGNRANEQLLNDELLPPQARRYVDTSAQPHVRYSYTLVVLGSSGSVRSETIRVGQAPRSAQLFQNRPNPFNPVTSIHYMLVEPAHTRLSIYSPSGRMVRTLFDGVRTPGTWVARWDGTDDAGKRVASGLYVYRLRAGSVMESKRMTLLK